MIEIDLSLPIAFGFFFITAALVLLLAYRERLFVYAESKNIRVENIRHRIKPFVALACIPAGFFLVEFPYNTELFAMDPYYVGIGILIMAALFAFIFFLGQRTKTSMMVFLLLCFVIGIASHFVALFKGQPILPSDVVALETAAAVGTGYIYTIDDSIVIAVMILELFACLFALTANTLFKKRSALISLIVAIIVAAGSITWYNTTNIEEEYNCTVDVWSSLDSYREHGALLCFLQRAQQLTPETPEGYSREEAQNLRSGTSETFTDETLSPAELSSIAQPLAESVQPSIVVIMNETFSDVSLYSAIDPSYEGIPLFRQLCEEALLSGNTYVSALGGGTCNSEFEFLTGSTTGLLGAGVYPYMLYNLQGVDNLASYLSSRGYETSAIHPASGSNWRRDRVYEQLGFDTFYDIDSFGEDTETRRDLVTDAATYDLVLEQLNQSDTPQFIFDVTIANHSGYKTGEIPAENTVHASVNGEPNSEVNEYLSCIRYSDIEFYEFINQLKNLDRPVIVCMFGDHQPGFADELAQASTGKTISDFTLEETQMRYVTPYIIWTNDDTLRSTVGIGDTRDMSLNYLGANLLKSSGQPLDEYFAFMLAIEQELPAINLNGYRDALSTWHWHGEDSAATLAYQELAIVQHDNLFDKED